jgi:signal transduction histidine kinase
MGGRTPRVLSWALWAAALGLVLASAFLTLLIGSKQRAAEFVATALLSVVAMVYVSVGGLIARSRPRNPIGWLLSLIGVVMGLTVFGDRYGFHGLVASPGSLPAVKVVASLGNGGLNFIVGTLLIVVLLFPDGRPLSRRWRPVVWVAVAVDVVGTLGFQLYRSNVSGITNSFADHHVNFTNALGIYGPHGAPSVVLAVAGALGVLTGLAAVIGLFLRRRRGSPELRQQLAWLGYVGVIAAAAFVLAIPVGDSTGWVGTVLWSLLFFDVLVGIPIACGVAVLRYHVYDLDVVVKKTVVFGALVALFTAVYAAVVIGIGAAIGHRGNTALTFAGAALAAILFQPVRARVRRFADRLVYGERATPYELLSQLSERLAGAYSTDDVLPRMAEIVATGTGAETARVWLHVGDELRAAASWPLELEAVRTLPMDDGTLPPSLNGEYAVEVRHQGNLLGALSVTMPASDPMNASKEKLIVDVASQAGLVLRNVRLTEELRARIDELRASRQRLVAAQDEERRKLERNLHDGAQQQLVAISVKARLAEGLLRKDPEKAAAMLSELQGETSEALDTLRELARGIYPPLLADRGLAAALEGHARRSPVPVRVEAAGLSRYPQEIEAAVYFCCLEALQNTSKYANASSVKIRIGADDGALRFHVTDDGAGFDAEHTPLGSGLRNMGDRLSALGGRLEIRSSPGNGTTVMGELPL